MKQFIEIKRGAKMPRLGMGTWFLGENPHRRNQEIEALRDVYKRQLSNGAIDPSCHVLQNTSVSILLYREGRLELEQCDIQAEDVRKLKF